MKILFLEVLMLCVLFKSANNYKIIAVDQSIQRSQEGFMIMNTSKIHLFQRMFIFPYNIYEYKSSTNTSDYTSNFLFSKVEYDQISQPFLITNETCFDFDQFSMLYEILPKTIIFQSQYNEYLQIIRTEESFYNNIFIVKNSTFDNYNNQNRKFDLNIYSLNYQSYIFASVQHSKSSLKDKKIMNISNSPCKNEALLFSISPSEFSKYQNYLFFVQMRRQVYQYTKWSMRYNGFSIYFVSASIKQYPKAQFQKLGYKMLETEDKKPMLDMHFIEVRQGQLVRIIHIKQPSYYMQLQSLKFFQICNIDETVKLLIGDSNNYYQIDITTNEWHMQTFKIDHQADYLFFGSECGIISIKQKRINFTGKSSELTKVAFQNNIVWSHEINNKYFVLCFNQSLCKVMSKSSFESVIDINLEDKYSEVLWSNFIILDQTMTDIIRVRNKHNPYKIYLTLKQQLANNSTLFYRSIQSIDIYANKSSFKFQQMDKAMFLHLQMNNNIESDNFNLTKDYYSFTKQLNESNRMNCSKVQILHNKQIYSISDQLDWKICSFGLQTQNYITLNLDIKQAKNFKLFICKSLLQNYNGQIIRQCHYSNLQKLQNKIQTLNLYNNNLIKFYIIKDSHKDVNIKFPTFFSINVERQQLEFVSSIFFYAMVGLAVSFSCIVFFMINRHIFIGLMIYFGWMDNRVEPTYPLSWLHLKIKLKRMRQQQFLRYTKHLPLNQDDNHCCFCLQTLAKGVETAQLYCLHEFHKDCFNQWIKNEPHARCPTCRREFTSEQYNNFQNSRHELD